MKTILILVMMAGSAGVSFCAGPARPQPYKIPAALNDVAEVLAPSAVHVESWLGNRIQANATNRLLTIDTTPLLAGFQKKPGSHPWIGEHIGKWMHAASLAWAYTGDERLRAKLDAAAAELISSQEPDGYLGTYVPEKRFGLYQGSDWDVWSHKYNLIGLLTYYEYTGNQAALDACRRMGDLLVATFGPGRKSILSAGTHVGMAATSVLEPIVVLYRFTGDTRYLDFARYIVKSWDEQNGPRIIQTLLKEKQVNKTANAKAYEMLSNLVGLCELARATGERELLIPVLAAWQDIVEKRLYITGSASQGEHFRDDHELPNRTGANVAETCVTTTWIQLNLQLLRLTGEARFANELEKTFYNHLAAAQLPRGDDWCYFTALEGKKPYTSGINCCHSSGPRGMALAPFLAYLKAQLDGADTVLVATLETSRATMEIGGVQVALEQVSGFPFRGRAELTLKVAKPVRFALGFRQPPWSARSKLLLNGTPVGNKSISGWAVIPAREWKSGDRFEWQFELTPRQVPGTHGNQGLAALSYGPFVMAYDSADNDSFPGPALVGFADARAAGPSGSDLARVRLTAAVRSPRLPQPREAVFTPFADAGASGGSYRVWLPAPGTEMKPTVSLLADGQEDRSRGGNVEGSINDDEPDTFVVTFDGRKPAEDWFAVTLDKPAKLRRVVFIGGNLFHDGGWFDASAGKPLIQVRVQKDGSWQTVGDLTDYPATTATDPASLRSEPGRAFTLRLADPVTAVAVRVIGKPASGDNPAQAFSSCAELQAFAD